MSSRKLQPSSIKNKIKREDEARKAKRTKRQDKLQRRLALAKEEAKDPALKRVRVEAQLSARRFY
jgi:ribosome production factor 1